MAQLCPWRTARRNFREKAPTLIEKEYIGWKLNQPDVCVQQFAGMHSIPLKNAYRWKGIVAEGSTMRLKAGRLPDITKEALLEIENEIIERRGKGISADIDDMKLVLQTKAKILSEARGVVLRRLLCERTQKKYLKDGYVFKDKKAQRKSEARMIAENDVMNAVSTKLMWAHAFQLIN